MRLQSQTLTCFRRLQEAGVSAAADVRSGSFHAFDMLLPRTAKVKQAGERLCDVFGQAYAVGSRGEEYNPNQEKRHE